MKWQFNLQEGDSLDIGTGTKPIVITVGASVYLLTYLENNLRSREHKGKYWFWGADFHILGRNEDPVWVRGADLNTERTGDPTLEAYWLTLLVDPWWGRFSQLLSTSTAALNDLRLPWTWSGEVFHILILIQEWGVGGKKVEGSIAFISELILWRKPKLKHLSASQIKRFSSRLRLIGWIRPHSQSSQFAGAWPNPA